MTALRRLAVVTAALLAAVALTACSGTDVELEGKLFEMAGISNLTKKSEAPKLQERTGIVVPPDLSKLPDPNQPPPVTTGDDVLASINDPDRAKIIDKAEMERRQAVACKEYDLAVARGDPDAAMIQGPLGYCRPSALGGVTNWFNGSSDK